MPIDPTKPLLKLSPERVRDRLPGRAGAPRPPEPFAQNRQKEIFAPKFDRLTEVLRRDPSGFELRADPTALAPERLLVFEVKGAVSNFATAVRLVAGLELIDEDELDAAEGDNNPTAYLMLPDVRALRSLESLWGRWLKGELQRGETPWRDVFLLLRDLRPWGPNDRVRPEERSILEQEIDGHDDDHLLNLEIELVYRQSSLAGAEQERNVVAAVIEQGGSIADRCRIDDIAYHALLVRLPVRAVRQVIAGLPVGIVGIESILYIRPQSHVDSIAVDDVDGGVAVAKVQQELGLPILAVLDGVPVAAHSLLRDHLVLEDQFGLEAGAPVTERFHGSAMASLIIHGDRNNIERPLPRAIYSVPVLGASDSFPVDHLIVDMIYQAVVRMKEGEGAAAPHVLIVNISLGNKRRPFHGQLSSWARLLDRLAYRYGILFVVSAGNCIDAFLIPGFQRFSQYEDADPGSRAAETLRAIGAVIADRRIFSPAETVNGLTIGACNIDAVPEIERAGARANVEPYAGILMANPSSALGPGFASSVKPDALMPGARERLRMLRNHEGVDVQPAAAGRQAGLKVAAPPRGPLEDCEGYTNGTSAAAALASRTLHRIHDALELAYGYGFLSLSSHTRAVLLKALFVHCAKWPDDAAALIRATLGPANRRQHVLQKDNIRRFLGYGVVDADDAISCAADRATFWAVGTLDREKALTIKVPVPASISGQARPHSLSATLAWFTPTAPGRRSYRNVRLRLIEPHETPMLGVGAHGQQPDANQSRRGTVISRCWSGTTAPVIADNAFIELVVQRDPDSGDVIDEAVPFGLAVTIAMPGANQIYEEVRQRLGIELQVA